MSEPTSGPAVPATSDTGFRASWPPDGYPPANWHTEATALHAAADDFGHLVHHVPLAVLRPSTSREVVTAVRYAGRHGLRIAARGAGHSGLGQSQAGNGIVIDMSGLNQVCLLGSDAARAEAGTTWTQVLRATVPHGLTPPVLTDCLSLSVGGTLSTGGLGGQSHRQGAQTDQVLELDVVTGAGRRRTCSPTRDPNLFHAVLAGLGQCAIILRATLRLRPTPASVRRYELTYSVFDHFLDILRHLAVRQYFDYLEGQATPTDGEPIDRYTVKAAFYTTATGPPPDDRAFLRDLPHHPEDVHTSELDYASFAHRFEASRAALGAAGLWDTAHPWLNLVLPDPDAIAFLRQTLTALSATALGPGGSVLLIPLLREHLRTPLLRIPGTRLLHALILLRYVAPSADPEIANRMAADNRGLYLAARAEGATRYPAGAVLMSPDDWPKHFAAAWPHLTAAKNLHDPRHILTPGPGIQFP